MQLHVFGDLSETHDQAALRFGLGGIFLVDPLLEANQLLQQQSHALIDLLAQHLVAVPAEGGKRKNDGRYRRSKQCFHLLDCYQANNGAIRVM